MQDIGDLGVHQQITAVAQPYGIQQAVSARNKQCFTLSENHRWKSVLGMPDTVWNPARTDLANVRTVSSGHPITNAVPRTPTKKLPSPKSGTLSGPWRNDPRVDRQHHGAPNVRRASGKMCCAFISSSTQANASKLSALPPFGVTRTCVVASTEPPCQ